MSDNSKAATRNIYCAAKGEGVIDHRTVNKRIQKIHTGCKKLDDQERSGRLKTLNSKAMLQVIEVNPMSNIPRLSGEVGKCSSSHHDIEKSI